EADVLTGILQVSQNNISDLTGFEYFDSIFGIYASHNNLTQVDFSNYVHKEHLYHLKINYNNLTELILHVFRSLQLLDCQNNQLTNDSLPDSYPATHHNRANNQLAELDEEASNLMELRCDHNSLTKDIIRSSIWDISASPDQRTNLF